MFFTEEQCNQYVTCQRCEETFFDPRSLPCGECVCNKCIVSHLENGSKQFKCFCCTKTHPVPEEGFPESKVMLSFMKAKPNGEIKMKALDDFKSEMSKIKDNLNILNLKVNKSDESIKDHCEMVRLQIEIRTDSIITKIEEYKEVLLKEVDDYENECINQIQNVKKRSFQQTLDENTELYNEYTNYVKRQKFDEDDLTKMNQNAILQNNFLSNEIKSVNAIIFNENKINFVEPVDEKLDISSIGTLAYKPINFFDINKFLSTANMKARFRNQFLFPPRVLDNGKIVIFHLKLNYNIYSLSMFNQDLSFEKTVKIPSDTNTIGIRRPVFSTFENQIIVNYPSSEADRNIMIIYNQDLSVHKKMKKSKCYTSICFKSDKIFCVGRADNGHIIDIYDLNLALIKRKTYESFTESNHYLEIEAFEDKLILTDRNKMVILNSVSLVEEVSLEMKIRQIFASKHKIYVVTFDNDKTFELKSFNSNGILQTKSCLIGYSQSHYLSFVDDKIVLSLDMQAYQFNKY
jgi:hypothetical protein